jgi:hypothetical protein
VLVPTAALTLTPLRTSILKTSPPQTWTQKMTPRAVTATGRAAAATAAGAPTSHPSKMKPTIGKQVLMPFFKLEIVLFPMILTLLYFHCIL